MAREQEQPTPQPRKDYHRPELQKREKLVEVTEQDVGEAT